MDFATLIWAAALIVSVCSGQEDVAKFQVTINADDTLLLDVGKEKAFSCKATRHSETNEMPTLRWFHNDVPITTNRIEDRIYVEEVSDFLLLRFDRVEDEDRGEYKCEGTVSSSPTPVSDVMNIETYEKMQIQSPVKQSGELGKDGQIECKVIGNPPPFRTWKFANDTRVPGGDPKYIMDGSILTIKELTFQDKGTYVCDLFVEKTSDVDKLRVEFEVYEIPEITNPMTFEPNNAQVGDSVKIYCSASGTPKPTYTFKRGENQIYDSDSETIDSENGVLTLKEVTRNSEGIYKCIASNIGGSVEGETTLDIKIPPTIKDISATVEASEDDEVVLSCVAEGDPAPTLTWEKVGGSGYGPEAPNAPIMEDVPSTDPDNAQIKTVGKNMKFQTIRPNDAGTYKCTAVSNVGTVEKETTINVKYKPHFDTDFKTTTFYAWKGQRANLTCMASANDLAVFQWYIVPSEADPLDYTSGNLIANDPTFTVEQVQKFPEYHLSSSSLMVYVNGEDSTVYRDYTCVADNGEKTAHVVTLREATTPEQPVLSVTERMSTSAKIVVTKPKDGGQPVNGFSYSYTAGGEAQAVTGSIREDEIQGDNTEFRINNLKPSTAYTLKMAATNAVGVGQDMTITFTTEAMSAPLKLDMTSAQEGFEPGAYTIQWADVEDGGSAVTKYIIKYRRIDVSNPEDPASQWVMSGDLETTFTTKEIIGKPGARQFKITGLSSNAFYDVRIIAVNSVGESDEEFNIIKTSAIGPADSSKAAGAEEEKNEQNKEVEDEAKVEEGGVGASASGNGTASTNSADSAGLGSGPIIGIVVIIILIIIIVVIVVLVKRKNLTGRLGLGAKGGDAEGGADQDGKAQAEEEKLISKDDTLKTETETGGDGVSAPVEETNKPEEYEPDNKPEVTSEPTPPAAEDESAATKSEEPAPVPAAEIKITPETPETSDAPKA